ncbi:hypothetical protein V495_00352 [Pseudogymnoascus sp. VKM F-4514 (FW-929)]|nr:hypothetical protein V495_00352 [Pseudogymnoascus sp. VKM F-4514 (FW-929)]KFY67022.1 hypothetical protein V497_00587 [Pseudogymnoascus sp. VKM F-4516 (FW-969)]
MHQRRPARERDLSASSRSRHKVSAQISQDVSKNPTRITRDPALASLLSLHLIFGSFFDVDGTTETSTDVVKSIGKESAEVAGDDVLLCSPTVLGFSLDRKLWLEFAIDDIEDIKWQPAALAHLQIPDKKKKAIQALSEAHMTRTSGNGFDDFVVGKG